MSVSRDRSKEGFVYVSRPHNPAILARPFNGLFMTNDEGNGAMKENAALRRWLSALGVAGVFAAVLIVVSCSRQDPDQGNSSKSTRKPPTAASGAEPESIHQPVADEAT